MGDTRDIGKYGWMFARHFIYWGIGIGLLIALIAWLVVRGI